MPHSSDRQNVRRPLARFISWWRTRSELADLECCGSAEVDRIARDLGISASELRTLASYGPNAAELLNRRMAALRIDPDSVGTLDPFTCATCSDFARPAEAASSARGSLPIFQATERRIGRIGRTIAQMPQRSTC